MGSGERGPSILMTSAPQWASTPPAEGTKAHIVRSMTRIPSSTFIKALLSPAARASRRRQDQLVGLRRIVLQHPAPSVGIEVGHDLGHPLLGVGIDAGGVGD